MQYDALMEKIGGCGRYQILIFCLLSVTGFKAGLQMQFIVFHTYRMHATCAAPWNSTALNTTLICIYPGMQDDNLTRCKSWSYDRSILHSSIVSEFDLVCDRFILVPVLMSITFLGCAVGSLGGFFGDRIGRRWVIILFAFYDMMMSILIAFVPSYEAQVVLRFLLGLGNSFYIQSCAFLTEIVSKRFRLFVGTNFWVSACIGYAGAAGFAKYLQFWRMSQLSVICVLPFYFSYFFFLWESPRWLLVKNRKTDAISILRRIAKWNGTLHKITDGDFESVRVEKDITTGRFLDTLSTPTMRLKTICAWYLMWTFSLSYIGISMDSKFSSDDIFLNSVYMGLIEAPAGVLAWIIGERFGRRKPSLVMLVATTTLTFLVPHLKQQKIMWLRTVLAIAGKLVLTAAYDLTYIWLAEHQPTCIRSVGFFSSTFIGSLGSVVSPFILHAANVVFWLPSLIIGVQCGLGIIVTYLLPETKGIPLQQTIEEADLLKRGRENEFDELLKAHYIKEEQEKGEMVLLRRSGRQIQY